VQWTSGAVARQCVRAIVAHPDLELVGMYAYSADKVGRDAGELVGLAPLGVAATDDVQALLALRPDCVCYTPLFPNLDELETILAAGVNVVTTSVFLTGWSLTAGARAEVDAVRRIGDAAARGGATIFGTGMNPGFASYLACVLTGICHTVQHVRVIESVDVGMFAGDDNMNGLGWGLPPDSPGHRERLADETRTFGDALDVMAAMLGVGLDDKRCTSEFAYATRDLDLPGRFIGTGTVGGIRLRWEGLVGGAPVLELQQVWVMSRHLEPAMTADHAYTVEVRGDPTLHTRMLILPAGDLAAMGPRDFHAVGMTITALPAVNAIPAVCRAAPGIRTYADLPVVAGHGRVVPG